MPSNFPETVEETAAAAPRGKTVELSGWGRYPRVRARVLRPEYVSALDLAGWGPVLARGQGRSYGDAAVSDEAAVVLTERLNRFLDFDESSGTLRAEAGATLAEVLEVFAPRGWFPAVTPGTKHVSLGGCVAADVHGKNHHRAGGFGAHVNELEVVLADGRRVRCSPEENADLFRATVGGMGLTGFITEVAFRLKFVETSRMVVRHHAARDLDALLRLSEDPTFDDEYTVGWVDLLSRRGRGVLMRGQHARASELPRELREYERRARRARPKLPFDLPAWALNRLTASAFNHAYYHARAWRSAPFVADFDQFFYPLDGVGAWNRAYGRRGFLQYQCVLPPGESAEGLGRLQDALAASRLPCFLAVLKRLGAEGPGLLSFPMPGYTLSLDFPVSGDKVFQLFRQFDDIVLERGGRVYLAKDACLRPEEFRRMYPRYPEWREIKSRFDPQDHFRSALSKRLGITQ